MKKPIKTLIIEAAFLVGVFALVALVLWLLPRETEKESSPVSLEKSDTRERTSTFDAIDADGDGLPNFEEALWSTDPGNPDTDGDGTNDGAEVAARRNPKKAAPNDSLETPVSVIRQEPEPSVVEQSLPPQTPTVPQIATPTAEPEKPQLSEDPLHAYGNAVGLLIQNAAVDSDAELAFWNSAAGNTKMNDGLIQGFVKLVKKYEGLLADIASVAPPPQAVAAHTALKDGYQNYAKAIRAIAETPIGSYMSAPAVTAYADSTLALARAVVGVSDLFYREGIGFTRADPGSIFVFPR